MNITTGSCDKLSNRILEQLEIKLNKHSAGCDKLSNRILEQHTPS